MVLRNPGSNEYSAEYFWNKDLFLDGPFSGADEAADQLELATLSIDAIQPIVGDGNCGYRSAPSTQCHQRHQTINIRNFCRCVGHAYFGNERYSKHVRSLMAGHLRESSNRAEAWAVSSDIFKELVRDEGTYRVTPQEYAYNIEKGVGFTHQFQSEEGYLVTRLFRFNLVIVTQRYNIRGEYEPQIEKFPVREPTQLNEAPIPEEIYNELCAAGLQNQIPRVRAL